jgi:nucleoside-diphosphate-sugar epimerase
MRTALERRQRSWTNAAFLRQPATMKVVITGASGYVGINLGKYLAHRGIEVAALSRHRPSGDFWSDWVPYDLGRPIQSGQLAGADCFVHCAWDFGPTTAKQIWKINGAGSLELLRTAQNSRVKKIIFISSASAYEGCRSLYGQAKLALEKDFLEFGGLVLRPGLIFGDPPGGTYGNLVKKVLNSSIVPFLTGSQCIQRLLHIHDLGAAIHHFLIEGLEIPPEPVFLAHPQDVPLVRILRQIASAQSKSPLLVPVPWKMLWLALKCGEVLGLQLSFRSDSLLGLAFYNRDPNYEPAAKLGWACRPYIA